MKMYILIPVALELQPGKIAAQVAHVSALMGDKFPEAYKLPVVCLYYYSKEELSFIQESMLLGRQPVEFYEVWEEPDYKFECISMAAIVPDDMQFKNQVFGKLRMV